LEFFRPYLSLADKIRCNAPQQDVFV